MRPRPDVDERGLHAGQHVLHAPEVDVADHRLRARAGDVVLDEVALLEHRDLVALAVLGDDHELVGDARRDRRSARGGGPARCGCPSPGRLRCGFGCCAGGWARRRRRRPRAIAWSGGCAARPWSRRTSCPASPWARPWFWASRWTWPQASTRRRRTGAGVRSSARRWTPRHRPACGSGSAASPARPLRRPPSGGPLAGARSCRPSAGGGPGRPGGLVGGGVVALALHRVALRGVLVDERDVVAGGAGGSGGASPAPAAAAAPAASPGGAGGAGVGRRVVAGGVSSLSLSIAAVARSRGIRPGRRRRSRGAGCGVWAGAVRSWSRPSPRVPPASGGAAAAPAGGRGARSGGLGRLRRVGRLRGRAGSRPRGRPLAGDGPLARGLPLRCGHAIADRLGDGCRRRCGRGRRSLPSLSRAGARSRDRLPGGEARLEPAPRGRRRAMSPPVGSVAVGAATSSLLIRTPFARSRGRAGGDRRTPDRGANPMRGSVVPVPPGLGACGPCPGPRARFAHPKRPCPAPAFPRSSARRRSSAGPAGRGSRALSVSRLGGAGRADLDQG